MKETRYLWISNLPSRSCENDIKSVFESYGRVLKIKVFEVGHAKGAVVVFLDSKAASQAFSASNALDNVILDIEYCESNGDPGFRKLKEKVSFKSEINNSNHKLENGSSAALFLNNSDERRTCRKSPSVISHIRSRSSSLSSSLSSYDQSGQGRNTISGKLSSEKSNKTDKLKNNDDSSNHDSTHSERNSNSGISRGIKITNLPLRSSDSSIRDGLFHEYKKYGKVLSVVVDGYNENRYAIVSFKCSEHADKAFEQLKTKVFFGYNVVLERHDGNDIEDTDLNVSDKVMDEYHYRATKTLFVGNLDSDIKTVTQLQDVFKEYGQILDVDIKQSSTSSYAFVQYVDIESVVRALENVDNVRLRGQKVKLGFGKSQANNCIWLSNLTDSASVTNESFLRRQFSRFGKITQILIDRKKWRALIYFDNIEAAQNSVAEIKNRGLLNKKVQIDYASRECQQHFVNDLYKTDQWHNEMSYNKAAYRTFARYMSSRDMYKYLTTLNMITNNSSSRCGSRERVYHDGYDKISKSQYNDQEYSEYSSNYRSNYVRSEVAVRRSSGSKVDCEGSNCYFDDDRKDLRYSSSNLASSAELGKQKSDSPYSVHSVRTETRSNSKSPPRHLNRKENGKKQTPSSDDDCAKRCGRGDKKLITSEVTLLGQDDTLGYRRAENKGQAEKRRQRRNLRKTNGRDLSDSSSSLSDSNESDAPQTTTAEVNQLKKLEREKALLLRQLSQLEDGEACRTEAVSGHLCGGPASHITSRLRPALHEVFDLDYQLDVDTVNGRRLHSGDNGDNFNNRTNLNNQRQVSNNKESLVRFEDQLQILRRASTKQQHSLSNNKTEPLTSDTVTGTTTHGTSSVAPNKSESAFTSSSNRNVDLPVLSDKSSGVVPVLHLQQLLSRTLQSQSCSLSSTTAASKLQRLSLVESTSSNKDFTSTKSLPSTPSPLPQSICGNTTPTLSISQQLPRDPRLLATSVSAIKSPISSSVTSNFVNQIPKSVTCSDVLSTSAISKTSLSTPSISQKSRASQQSSLVASTSLKTILSTVMTSVKSGDEDGSSDISDPENETVMKQHRSLEDRIKALDAKLTKVSEPARPLIDYSKYKIKKKSLSSISSVAVTSSGITPVTYHEPRTGTSSTTEFVKSMMKSNVFAQDCRRLEQSALLFDSERSVCNATQPLTIGIGSNNNAIGASSSLYSPTSRGYISQSSYGSMEKNLHCSPSLINGLSTSWNNSKCALDSAKTSRHSNDASSPDSSSIRSILKKEAFSPVTTAFSKLPNYTLPVCTLTSPSTPMSSPMSNSNLYMTSPRGLKSNCKLNSPIVRDTKRLENFRDAQMLPTFSSSSSKFNWNNLSSESRPDSPSFSVHNTPQKRKAVSSFIESGDETATATKLSASVTNCTKDASLFKLANSTRKDKSGKKSLSLEKRKVNDGEYTMSFKSEDIKRDGVEKSRSKFENCEPSSKKFKSMVVNAKKFKKNCLDMSEEVKKERLKGGKGIGKKLSSKTLEKEERKKKKEEVKVDILSYKKSNKSLDGGGHFDKSSKSYSRKLKCDEDCQEKDKTSKQKKSSVLANNKRSDSNEDEWKPSGRSSASIWGFDRFDYGPYESMYDKIKRRGGRCSQSGKGAEDAEKTSPSLSKMHADLQAWLSDVTEENLSDEGALKKKKANLKSNHKRFKHDMDCPKENSFKISPILMMPKNENGSSNCKYSNGSGDDGDDEYIHQSKRKRVNKKQSYSMVNKAKRDQIEIKSNFVQSIPKNKMTVDSVFGPSSSEESGDDDDDGDDESTLESCSNYVAKTPSTDPMTDESQTESSNDELHKSVFNDDEEQIKPRYESKLQDLFSDANVRIDLRAIIEKKTTDDNDDDAAEDDDDDDKMILCTEDLPSIEKIPYNEDNIEKSPGSIDEEPPSLLDVDMDGRSGYNIFIEETVTEENTIEPMDSNDLDSAVALMELSQGARILLCTSPPLQLESSDSINECVTVVSEEFRGQLSATISNLTVTAEIVQPLIVTSSRVSLPTELKTNLVVANQESLSSSISASLDSAPILTTSLHHIRSSIMPTTAVTPLAQIDTPCKTCNVTPVDQLKKEDMENYVKSVMKKVEEETKQATIATSVDKMCKRMKKSTAMPSLTNAGVQVFDKCNVLDLRPVISDVTSAISLALPQSTAFCKATKPLLPTNILPLNTLLPVPTTLPSLTVQLCKPLLPCVGSVVVTCSSATSIMTPGFDTISNDKVVYSVDEQLKRRTVLRRKRNSDSSVRSNVSNDNINYLTSLEDTINSVLTQTPVPLEKVDAAGMFVNTAAAAALKLFELNESEHAVRELEKSVSQMNDSDTELDPYEPNFDETPAFDLKALQHKPSVIRTVDTCALFETNNNNSMDNSKEVAMDSSPSLITTPTTINNFLDTNRFFAKLSPAENPTLEADKRVNGITSVLGNDNIMFDMGTISLNMAAPVNVPTERKSRAVRPMDAETIRHVEEVIELVAHGDVSLEDHIQRIFTNERIRSNSGDEHTLQRLSVNSSIATVTPSHMVYPSMLLPSHKDNINVPSVHQLSSSTLLSSGNMASSSSSSVADVSTNPFLSNNLFKDDEHKQQQQQQQQQSVHIGVAGQSYTTVSETDEHGYVVERLANPACLSGSSIVPGSVASMMSSSSMSTSVKNTVLSLDTPICGPHTFVQQQQQQQQQQDNPILLYNTLQAYAAMFRAGQQSDPFPTASLFPHMATSHDPSHLYASYLLNMANREVATSESVRQAPSSVVVPSLSDGLQPSITTHGQPSTLDISHFFGGNISSTAVSTIVPSFNDNVQRDHMLNLMQKYPIVWQGRMALKNEEAGVQMHFVCGSSHLVKISMNIAAAPIAGESQPLKIVQRMRLEQQQLEGVCRKMQDDNDYCMLLAVACGHDDIDYQRQTISLNSGFIKYLQEKSAAGIVNVNVRDQPAYVVHIFPPSEFSRDKLGLFARDLLQALYARRDMETPHLLVVITTV